MNPTTEQLDTWSAEALGWENGGNGGVTPEGFVCWVKDYRDGVEIKETEFTWHPSTDLSQAWREFVPVLKGAGWRLELRDPGFAEVWNDDLRLGVHSGKMDDLLGDTDDQKAAYALTYAFVQAVEPKGYLKWIEDQ